MRGIWEYFTVATSVYTIEELIDRVQGQRSRLSSAISLLNRLKIQRDQLFAEAKDAQDVDTTMVANLTEVFSVVDQVRADIAALGDGSTLFNAIEVRPGQRSNKTGGTVPTELHHFAILYNVGPGTSATLVPEDADNAAVEGFADLTSQLLVANDKVEFYNAEDSGNNGIHTVSSCTDILLTVNDAIPGGADNATDEKIRVRKVEDQA